MSALRMTVSHGQRAAYPAPLGLDLRGIAIIGYIGTNKQRYRNNHNRPAVHQPLSQGESIKKNLSPMEQ